MQKEKSKNRWVAIFKIVTMQAGAYLTAVTMLMMALTFYHTTLVEWATGWGITIPLWLFLCIIIGGGAVFLWFEWKFMVGDFYSSWNKQWWDNDNPMKEKMEILDAKIEELMNRK